MRRGFTIIELLVASLLLGMLTTILTMLFNQSSISWRTGTAMVLGLEDVREEIAEIRHDADELYPWKSGGSAQKYRILSPWKSADNQPQNWGVDRDNSDPVSSKIPFTVSSVENGDSGGRISVGQADKGQSQKSYVINVKSGGPDGELDTWDDIWSYPDDFE